MLKSQIMRNGILIILKKDSMKLFLIIIKNIAWTFDYKQKDSMEFVGL